MNYKPLPDGLFIKDSNIEGQGLFTNRDLTIGCNLGTSHYRVGVPFIRTPLGGFINHSNTPNCSRVETRISSLTTKWNVIVVENIAAGDELTLKYTMYKPEGE
jgi:hypothetical protein